MNGDEICVTCLSDKYFPRTTFAEFILWSPIFSRLLLFLLQTEIYINNYKKSFCGLGLTTFERLWKTNVMGTQKNPYFIQISLVPNSKFIMHLGKATHISAGKS